MTDAQLAAEDAREVRWERERDAAEWYETEED